MTFGNPDFVKYAESYGAKGSRIGDIASLRPTLEKAFTDGGVHVRHRSHRVFGESVMASPIPSRSGLDRAEIETIAADDAPALEKKLVSRRRPTATA